MDGERIERLGRCMQAKLNRLFSYYACEGRFKIFAAGESGITIVITTVEFGGKDIGDVISKAFFDMSDPDTLDTIFQNLEWLVTKHHSKCINELYYHNELYWAK